MQQRHGLRQDKAAAVCARPCVQDTTIVHTCCSEHVEITSKFSLRSSRSCMHAPLCRMAGSGLLLALPDSCMLAVLQCLASDDQRSLFSAARANSRLHQAAVVALYSITARIFEQQQMDSQPLEGLSTASEKGIMRSERVQRHQSLHSPTRKSAMHAAMIIKACTQPSTQVVVPQTLKIIKVVCIVVIGSPAQPDHSGSLPSCCCCWNKRAP